MSDVTISEIARNLADYINRVVYRGERFTLLRGKKPVAELRPVPRAKKLGDLKSLFSSLPSLSKEESELFLKDLNELKKETDFEILANPWES